MFNNRLSVEVGYSGEQVLESRISLGINLILRFGNWFWLARVGRIRGILLLTQGHSSLFNDRLAYVMSYTVEVDGELLVVGIFR